MMLAREAAVGNAKFSERAKELSQECAQTYGAVRAYLMDKPLQADSEPPEDYQKLLARAQDAVRRYLSHCSFES